MRRSQASELLGELYDKLWRAFGSQGWWPGDSPLEVALGAILTQNTNWTNVARVLDELKTEGLLEVEALLRLPEAELARLLRPVGYFNVKARRLRNFLEFLEERFQGEMDFMAGELEPLRTALLEVKGVGPETADSILLYALHLPTFVVDAYTGRILSRHGLIPESCTYEELRAWFMDHLPPEVPHYQEFHALLVRLGKDFCRPRPNCSGCPLEDWPEPR